MSTYIQIKDYPPRLRARVIALWREQDDANKLPYPTEKSLLEGVVSRAFKWHKSLEGYHYWMEIARDSEMGIIPKEIDAEEPVDYEIF